MSLFAELKRRNVIRMAGLYLVGAWLIAQVAETILPAFEVPNWVMRMILVLLALGFVPALVFAWIFELTPAGIKRDAEIDRAASIAPQTAQRMNRIFIAVLVLALTFFCFDRFVMAPRRDAALVATTTQSVQQAVTAAERVVDSRSIAVLPFVNMSQDKGNEFFADGISEELLNVLVRVEGLGVASRTSSFAFKGKEVPVSEIADQLKVRYVLEGSVRKQADTVRITAQLIDANDDRHVWSETYDRELTDIFKIQDEIANAIVSAVRGSLTTANAEPAVRVRADTENMQAYELYLKARENFIARRDISETAGMFERVVQMDPNFARGWEGLAAVSTVAPSWGVIDRDYQTLAKQAAERALQLDPSLSMPWAVLANIEEQTWPINFDSVLSKFDKAIAADPHNATAWLWRGIALIRLGFFDRALADLDRAIAAEPNYPNAVRHKALALLLAGREDEAFALFDSGIAEGFIFSRSENFIAALMAHGHRGEAMLLMGVAAMAPELRDAILAKLDNPLTPVGNARALVERYPLNLDDPALSNLRGDTILYLWLGDYESVANSDDRGTGALVTWDRYPPSWRNSPGMKRKLQGMGAVDYWRAKGFPPQCHPAGPTDFNCD
jgi:adenylate cyclase